MHRREKNLKTKVVENFTICLFNSRILSSKTLFFFLLLRLSLQILNLSIIFLADGYPAAVVKVSSQQEAQYIISQLHRQKLGSKRIVISYTQNNIPMRNLNQLRAMIVALLQVGVYV